MYPFVKHLQTLLFYNTVKPHKTASFRQRHYFIVPPACGMRGGTPRGEAAGEFFRRVWVLQGGYRVNIPLLFQDRSAWVRPDSGRFVAVNGHTKTHPALIKSLCLSRLCLKRLVGSLSAPEPPSIWSLSWPLRFTGVPAAASADCGVHLTGCEWELAWKANREILLGLVAEHFIQKQYFEELRERRRCSVCSTLMSVMFPER